MLIKYTDNIVKFFTYVKFLLYLITRQVIKRICGMANQSNKVSENILLLLKRQGALRTADIADHFHLTTMAVRQHLHIHMQNELVKYFDEPAERGRPKRMWTLSEKAHQQFPKDADLFLEYLVDFIPEQQRALGFQNIFERYTQRMQQTVNAAMMHSDARSHIPEILTSFGYFCDVETITATQLLVHVYHCPHAHLLDAYPELIELERQLIQQVFCLRKVDIIASNAPFGYHMQYTIYF